MSERLASEKAGGESPRPVSGFGGCTSARTLEFRFRIGSECFGGVSRVSRALDHVLSIFAQKAAP